MKKPICFRPEPLSRRRLETLVKATGHSLTYHVSLCVTAHLPALEKRYARELAEMPPESDYALNESSPPADGANYKIRRRKN